MESAIVLNIKRVSWHNKGSLKKPRVQPDNFPTTKISNTHWHRVWCYRIKMGFWDWSIHQFQLWWILAPKLADLVAADVFVSCFLIFLEAFSSSIFVCRKKCLVAFNSITCKASKTILRARWGAIAEISSGKIRVHNDFTCKSLILNCPVLSVFAKIYEDIISIRVHIVGVQNSWIDRLKKLFLIQYFGIGPSRELTYPLWRKGK